MLMVLMVTNLISSFSSGYQLIDSALSRKCEIIENIKVERHSPQAIWSIKKFPKEWNDFHATSIRKKDGGGQWQFHKKIPEPLHFQWESELKKKFTFELKLTSFGHCGLFFEQAALWNKIEQFVLKQTNQGTKELKFLNLFGYTGAASIVAAKAGAQVTHIDSAKGVLSWGKNNGALNKIPDGQIKWIHEDALTYVKNAVKRNLQFDGILADPPSWGHGVKNEVWNFEENLSELLQGIQKILKPQNSFFILTSHTQGVQAEALHNLLNERFKNGTIHFGDLGIQHSKDDRILPAGVYALHQNL
jgi:23S rRNA (cytosine1962-C5)-methyltransferase